MERPAAIGRGRLLDQEVDELAAEVEDARDAVDVFLRYYGAYSPNMVRPGLGLPWCAEGPPFQEVQWLDEFSGRCSAVGAVTWRWLRRSEEIACSPDRHDHEGVSAILIRRASEAELLIEPRRPLVKGAKPYSVHRHEVMNCKRPPKGGDQHHTPDASAPASHAGRQGTVSTRGGRHLSRRLDRLVAGAYLAPRGSSDIE